MEKQELSAVIEAILFASLEPLSVKRLQELINLELDEEAQLSLAELSQALEALSQSYQGRAIELKEIASGFCFQVRPSYANWMARLWEEKPPRFSRAFLETLALIAYRQPVTRAEIEEIRGVSVSPTIMKNLLEREWIQVVGHKEVPGRPAIFATTTAFLDHFNLKSLEDLPQLALIEPEKPVQADLPLGEN